jgi:hypothetical protein
VDYFAHKTYNDMQEIKYCVGELNEDEYEMNHWQAADLQPLSGGCIFEAKESRTGYTP